MCKHGVKKFNKISPQCFRLNLTNGAYPSREINDRREVLNDGLVEFEISTNGLLRIMDWNSLRGVKQSK